MVFITKMSETKLRIIMCPAVILANNLIIKAKGFVNNPINSTGIRKNLTQTGMPGIQNKCIQ